MQISLIICYIADIGIELWVAVRRILFLYEINAANQKQHSQSDIHVSFFLA